MKSHSLSLLVISFAILGLSIPAIVRPPFVIAQTNCPTITPTYTNNPSKGAWAAGAEVNVNIDPSFNPQEKAAIVAALEAWNAKSGYDGNGSRPGIPPHVA
jgi:hypothetical protein